MVKLLALTSICIGHICTNSRVALLSNHLPAGPVNDSIELNLPFSEHYFRENSSYRKEGKNGCFSLSLPRSNPKVVLLRYHEKEQWVLLSSNRILRVKPDAADTTDLFSISGKGKTENQLLKQLTPRSGLWFSAGITRTGHVYTGKNPYVYWPKDSLIRILYPLIKQSLDSSEKLIDKITAPKSVKETLSAEVKYYYANELTKLVYGWALVRINSQEMETNHFNELWWAELSFFNMPSQNELEISQSAKIWMDSYLEVKYSQRLDSFTTDPDKRHAEKVYGAAIGLSWDQRQKLMTDIGQAYPIIVIERRNILPAYGEERRLADIIFRGANDDLTLAKKVLQDNLIKDFPSSKYIELCQNKIAAAEKLKTQNIMNPEIHIINNSDSITSLAKLLAPYKGKTIFLDLWATWCGPCVKEINSSTMLKQQFKDKNIVFLYLDLDEDKKDGEWKDFIYMHNLTGEHVRMNQSQINKIWRDLGEQSQSYPRYYIFDKEGFLFLKNANRPSSGEILYAQLNSALNK